MEKGVFFLKPTNFYKKSEFRGFLSKNEIFFSYSFTSIHNLQGSSLQLYASISVTSM